MLNAGGPVCYCLRGVVLTVKIKHINHLRVLNTEMSCSVIVYLLLTKIDSSNIEETIRVPQNH